MQCALRLEGNDPRSVDITVGVIVRIAMATINVCDTYPLSYRRNGMSIFVLPLYSGYALGKVAARFRSSTVPL